MLKGLGDIGQIMKLQKEFKNTQKKLTKTRMDGQSASGQIKATVTGEYKLVDISIDPDLIKSADGNILEKEVISAVNDAVDRIKDYTTSEMGKLTGGLDIPGLGSFLK